MAIVSSTGIPYYTPHFPIWKCSQAKSQDISGIYDIRWRRATIILLSRQPVPKRCSATVPLPFTPRMIATDISSGKKSFCHSSSVDYRSSPTTMSIRNSVPGASRLRQRMISMITRSASGTTCPSSIFSMTMQRSMNRRPKLIVASTDSRHARESSRTWRNWACWKKSRNTSKFCRVAIAAAQLLNRT